MTTRMEPAQRRARIVDAALAVMLRKGIAATTVRDVAAEMGSSAGLVHHYFSSMDDLLATAFEQAASLDLESTRSALTSLEDPVEQLRAFFATYIRADQDWAFQLWLDAWAEAARRPALQSTSQRLNVAWQQVLTGVITAGVSSGEFTCPDPDATGWRILSMLDGLALQTVAHRVALDRSAVLTWSIAYAESELGLAEGTLT
ncbi:putative TetR-family transcriptional regulator [metagenome]|uniref:Putative TetR-family transcriptional regulator n=1 Tax=metagenome TaxID=256318 RepID=A0A2P2C9C8_9ZZZZ